MVVGREHRSDARRRSAGHLPTKTMATNTTRPTDEKVSTVPRGAAHLGVDAEGRDHFATSMPHATVLVVDGDSVETWDIDSEDNPLSDVGDWVEHTRDVCGWDQLFYGQGLVEMLAGALEGEA